MNAVGDDPAEKKRAVLLLFLAALMWSLGGVLIKSVSWDSMGTAGMRSLIAVVVLFAYRPRMSFSWSKPQLLAALSYAGTVIFFVAATKNTTAANAILLQYTSPIYVAILGAIFLGESPRRGDWLSIVAVMAGIGLFFADQLALEGYWGNIFALLSGVCFAVFVVSMRLQKHASPLESVVLGNIIAAIIGLSLSQQMVFQTNDLLLLTVLGVLQLGVPYILYSYSIKHVTALEALLIPAVEPIANPLLVLLIVGERPGPWALVGGAIVLGAVFVRATLSIYRAKARVNLLKSGISGIELTGNPANDHNSANHHKSA